MERFFREFLPPLTFVVLIAGVVTYFDLWLYVLGFFGALCLAFMAGTFLLVCVKHVTYYR